MAEPWTNDVQRVYESTALHDDQETRGLTEADRDRLLDANFAEEQLREIYEEGFLTRSTDPEVSPDDRYFARETYFDWMDYLGYSRSDYDWQSWREYMGY